VLRDRRPRRPETHHPTLGPGARPSAGRNHRCPSACALSRPGWAAEPGPYRVRRCVWRQVCAPEQAHMPAIMGRLTSAKGSGVIADDSPILPDHDPRSTGMTIAGRSERRRQDRVFFPQGIDPPDQFLNFVIVEPNCEGLRDWRRRTVEPVERSHVGHKLLSSGFEDFPDRPLASSGRRFALAPSMDLSRSEAFRPSRQVTRRRGGKNRSRIRSTWVAIWPFPQSEARVLATGWTG